MESTMYMKEKKTRQNVSLNEAELIPTTKIRRISTCQSKHYRAINAGWGACRYSWCGCRGFKKPASGWVCANCGHSYDDHF